MSSANIKVDLRRLRKAGDFYAANHHLFKSRDAFRKQLQRRHLNGLAAAGAIVETSLGLMADPHNFRLWLLTPEWRGQ